ncbi:MAG: hypothetical protein DME54_04890 [Verrucomicrobia bacterium]|nr:MAG: hypothetical protein DME54_04890 [Verrucomicrobiota bacterium]
MKLTIVFVLTISSLAAGDDLPRRAKTPRENYPNVDVIYDSVTASDGHRLRTIITKSHDAKGKLPVKQGVGDSEGDCAANDFESELAGYRAAFRTLKKYDFIDANRVYMLGISNGGGFAPLIPESESEQAQVVGYVSVGGWVKTWFEHMLEIERRRFALMGKSPGEVTERMKRATTLYYEWLVKGRSVPEIVKERPELAGLWPDGKDATHLYGRPLKFYEQLHKLNLAAAWSRVKVPSIILHGQYDWIMSREDPELMAQYVDANRPGAARFMEVPEMGHTFQHYLSWADAFAGKSAPFDPKMLRIVTDWLEEQQREPAK